MNIAVAAFALRGFGIAQGQRLPVNAIVVQLLFVGMAGDALGLRQSRIVRNALDVGMAIHAGEHRAVDRSLECVAMHFLAVDHRPIVVAGKAIVAGRLGLGCGLGPCAYKPGAPKHQANHPQ